MGVSGTIQEADRQTRSSVQNPIPAIIIGLGGTGGEVLLRIRKKFFEASGTFDPWTEWPIINYLYIDTDEDDKDVDKYHGQFYSFKNEFLPATIPDYQVYTHNLTDRPSLRKWWYEDQTELKSPALRTGAGQIRGYSRLAFWLYADRIRERIQQLAGRCMSPRAQMSDRNITVDWSRLWVYVVGSIAGGTGSGVFLDLGYLLRDMNLPGLESMAFLVFPSVFNYLAIPKERLRANSYATLMELEYYSSLQMRGGSFDDKWSDERPDKPTTLSPFNRVFLVDGMNLANQVVGEKEAREGLLDLVADHIYMDYAVSQFGGAKRSTYVNMDDHLHQEWFYDHRDPNKPERIVLTEKFSQSYQTFGLSKIYIPLQRIKKSVACEIWARSLRKLSGSLAPGDIRPTRDHVLQSERVPLMIGKRRSQGQTKEVNDFRTHLLKDQTAGGTLLDLVRKSGDNVRRRTREGVEKQRPRYEFLSGEIEALHDELFIQPSQNPSGFREWGRVFRLMELNRQEYLERLKSDLNTVGREFASDLTRGIGFSIELLKDIQRLLVGEAEGMSKRWKGNLDKARAAVQLTKKAYDTAVIELREHEHWGVLEAPLLKSITVAHDIDRSARLASGWFEAIVNLRFLENSILVAEQSSEVIAEIIERLEKLSKSLTGLAERLQRRAEEFRDETVSPLNECPYTPDDVPSFYIPKALGIKTSPITEEELDAACLARTAEILQTLRYPVPGEGMKPLGIYDFPQAMAQLEQEQMEFLLARAALPYLAALDDVNVVSVFARKYPDVGVRQAKINSVIQYATPWYARNSKFEDFRAEKIYFFYSYFEEEGEEFRLFEKAVATAQVGKLPLPTKKDAREKDSVIFFAQMAGFPLCYGTAIPDLDHAYNQSLREGAERLHISREEDRFPRISRLDKDGVNRLREATKVFIVGVALGVIKILGKGTPEGDDGRYIYYYSQKKLNRLAEDRQLGRRRSAIQHLMDDVETRRTLWDSINAKLAELEDTREIWNAYAVILWHFNSPEGKYAMRSRRTGGGKVIEEYPMEYRILEEYYEQKAGKDKDPTDLLARCDSFSRLLPDGHRALI